MGKNKKDASGPDPKGGRHKTARKMVGLPEPWYAIAEQLAANGPTPVVWYLVKLIEKDATAAGITDLPPPPWKTEEK